MSAFSEIVGSIVINLTFIIIVWKLLKGLWTCGLGYYLGFGVKWCPAPDVWAVITGGTDGIGLEYAKQLAQKGYSILILSRSEEKLKRVANDIKRKYPKCTEVKTFAVDFQNTHFYGEIEKVINSLNKIDVLINNVGVMIPPEYSIEIPMKYNESLINVNIISQIKMCEMILPKMVNQKRGIIINISSMTALMTLPIFTTYSSTKAFNNVFSRGLSIEYASKGIVIQSVLPGLVFTNLIPKGSYFLQVTTEQFVSTAIKTVGIEWSTHGHWKHKFGAFMLGIFLTIFWSKLFGYSSIRSAEKIRDQALIEMKSR